MLILGSQQVPIINDKNDLLGNNLVLKKITTKKWKPIITTFKGNTLEKNYL